MAISYEKVDFDQLEYICDGPVEKYATLVNPPAPQHRWGARHADLDDANTTLLDGELVAISSTDFIFIRCYPEIIIRIQVKDIVETKTGIKIYKRK